MELKNVGLIIFLLMLGQCRSQGRDAEIMVQPGYYQVQQQSEILSSGFMDIMNSGQLNVAARFIRLNIGEPGKFSVPVSLYTGVSSNGFQNGSMMSQYSNELLATNLINPFSGLANVSTDGLQLFGKRRNKVTGWGILYQLGARVLSGMKQGYMASAALTARSMNFINSFGSIGFYFQTGAWEKYQKRNVGVSWWMIRYISSWTNKKSLLEIMPGIQTNGFYTGYSLGWGVEVTKLVNFKVIYYKYLKEPEVEYYSPIYQFSVNYSLRS